MERLEKGRQFPHPFNSSLETGIRAVMILDSLYPRRCDLMEMTWLDYLVVHTGDLEGGDAPESLHPDLPNRAGELLVRRQLVERSLRVMQQVHLIDVFETESGIVFAASEGAPSYLDALQSPYSIALKARANWMACHFRGHSAAEIKEVIEGKIGRWIAEFRTDEVPSGAP